jgi:hypothetical protein
LVFGLATRFAALPMLILSLVIQFSYQALDQHLFWAILFGWFVVKGAGPISLDALIGRDIAATALPLAGTITDFFEALSRWGDPATKLLLRCWELLLPELAVRLTILIELACLVFLVLGAGKDHSYHTDWIERAGRPDLPAVDRSRLLSDGARAHCSSRTRGVVD